MRAFVSSPFFLISACAVVAGYRLKLFFSHGIYRLIPFLKVDMALTAPQCTD